MAAEKVIAFFNGFIRLEKVLVFTCKEAHVKTTKKAPTAKQ